MSRRWNLDLNYLLKSDEELKKELRQTMMSQDQVFRAQVSELHRLYKVQKQLMEVCGHEFQGTNLQKQSMHSTSVSLGSQIISKFSLKERAFSVVTRADLVQSNSHLVEPQRQQNLGFMQRPFDLRLPADDFINLSGNYVVEKGDHRNSVRNAGGAKYTLRGKYVSDQVDEVKPPLSRKVGLERDGNSTFPICHDIIDLEQTSSRSSNSAITACKLFGKSVVDVGFSSQKQPTTCSGINSYPGDMQSQFSASGKTFCLDLNTAQTDIWSQSLATYPSFGSSSNAFHCFGSSPSSSCSRKPDTAHALGRDLHSQAGAVDLNVVAAEENASRNWTMGGSYRGGSRSVYIDLEAEPDELPLDSGEQPNGESSTPADESVGSRSKNSSNSSSNKHEADASGTQTELGNAFGDSAEHGSRKSGNDEISNSVKSKSVSAQSSSITGLTFTAQHGSSSGLNRSEKSGAESQTSDSPSGDQRTQESNNGRGLWAKPSGIDDSIEKAAALLMDISLGSGKSPVQEEMSTVEEDQPHRSLDSYECLVLEQQEVGPEDYCLSTSFYEIPNSEMMKPCPYKLKRGTRVRDFQKDLLPVMSTLARNEICEDINIFEGVLRSREYKRIRSQKGLDATEWSRPARGRRSRGSISRRI